MIQELVNIRDGLISNNIFEKVFLGIPRQMPGGQFLLMNIISGNFGAVQDNPRVEFRIIDEKEVAIGTLYDKLDELRDYIISNDFGYFTYEIGNIYGDYDNLGRPFVLMDIIFSKLIIKK